MTWSDGRLFEYLRKAVLGSFVIALACGLLLPIFSDEVGWRLQERAWLDGVDKIYSDQCGPNTLAVPPLFMWPVRWYSAFFNSHFPDPFFVRLSGVFYAMLWIWLVVQLIGRVGRNGVDRHVMVVICTALMGLGVTPLLLVWSRPEQPILLATTTALLIASAGWRSPGNLFGPFADIAYTTAPASTGTAWWRSLCIFALGAIALSYHFKAVLLMPVFGAAILYASRGRRTLPIRLIALALLGACTLTAAQYWVGRMECPGDPLVAAAHAHENLAGELALGGTPPGVMAGKVLGNFRLHKYVDMAAPLVKPMSQWLPYNRVSDDEMHGWQGGMAAIWALALIAGACSVGITARRAWRQRVLAPEPVMAVLLFGAVLLWCVSQMVRHVYEVTFVLPLTMLAIVMALAAPHRHERLRQGAAVLALAVGPLMVLSQVLIASYYGGPLLAAAQARGYVAGQTWSVPVFGYGAVRRELRALASDCHLPPMSEATNLLIDDTTYFTFMQSRLPQHQLAILAPTLHGSISDPVAYLRSRHSSGLILGCQWLPTDLRHRAHMRGLYCCLTPDEWPQTSAAHPAAGGALPILPAFAPTSGDAALLPGGEPVPLPAGRGH